MFESSFPGWPESATLGGLFAGVVASRLIEWLPIDREGGSWRGCPSCGYAEPLASFLPLIGAILSGRCTACHRERSERRAVIEAGNAVLWLMVSAVMPPSLRAWGTMIFVSALLVLSLIDLEHLVLPDVITLPAIIAGVVGALLPGWPVSFPEAGLTAGLGYFGMMFLARLGRAVYGEEALGQGDWKLVAMLGAFLGASKTLAVVLAGTVLGATVGLGLVAILGDRGRRKLPLGTFLGAAGIVNAFI